MENTKALVVIAQIVKYAETAGAAPGTMAAMHITGEPHAHHAHRESTKALAVTDPVDAPAARVAFQAVLVHHLAV